MAAAARAAPPAGPHAGRARGGVRRRRAGGARGAPSAVAGRWSLADRLFRDAPAADERRRILAELLVERHGVLTRSAVLSEGVPGGYAGVYPALTDLETLGTVRRGYFVAGLGGAQFAMPGAVERLRDLRDAPTDGDPHVLVLGAADPAQPYGAAAPWPKREGAPLAVARVRGPGGAGGRRARPVPGARRAEPPDVRGAWRTAAWSSPCAGLADWILADRRRRAAIERVDGEPVFGSPLEPLLADAGFRTDLRGMVLRA